MKMPFIIIIVALSFCSCSEMAPSIIDAILKTPSTKKITIYAERGYGILLYRQYKIEEKEKTEDKKSVEEKMNDQINEYSKGIKIEAENDPDKDALYARKELNEKGNVDFLLADNEAINLKIFSPESEKLSVTIYIKGEKYRKVEIIKDPYLYEFIQIKHKDGK